MYFTLNFNLNQVIVTFLFLTKDFSSVVANAREEVEKEKKCESKCFCNYIKLSTYLEETLLC